MSNIYIERERQREKRGKMVFSIYGLFLKVVKESWPEWNSNSGPLTYQAMNSARFKTKGFLLFLGICCCPFW